MWLDHTFKNIIIISTKNKNLKLTLCTECTCCRERVSNFERELHEPKSKYDRQNAAPSIYQTRLKAVWSPLLTMKIQIKPDYTLFARYTV